MIYINISHFIIILKELKKYNIDFFHNISKKQINKKILNFLILKPYKKKISS
jgi:hypothetical protein